MVRQRGRPLVSQRRDQAAREVPYEEPDAGRGPRRPSGQPREDRPRPAEPGPVTSMEAGRKTPLDHRARWPQTLAALRHVEGIGKTHLQTHHTAPGGWCSRDGTWSAGRLIDADRVRCPRQLHVREATPDGGLEDCMRVPERPVSTRAHLALGMVHVAPALIRPRRTPWPACRVRDLQAGFRGRTDVGETCTVLPERPAARVRAAVGSHMAALGRVHHAVHPASMARVLYLESVLYLHTKRGAHLLQPSSEARSSRGRPVHGYATSTCVLRDLWSVRPPVVRT